MNAIDSNTHDRKYLPLLKPELGQVLTPPDVALWMAEQALRFAPPNPVILDPAVGPGTFPAAFARAGATGPGFVYHVFDVDQQMITYSQALLDELDLQVSAYCADYLLEDTQSLEPDVIVMNPPYIRQELIPTSRKRQYSEIIEGRLKRSVSRQSNLYVYFLLKAITELRPGGVLAAIVYDSITATRYGRKAYDLIEQHLDINVAEHVSSPFADVLIDGLVIVGRKRQSPKRAPRVNQEPVDIDDGRFTSLGHLVEVRRGLGLLNSRVFMAQPTDDDYHTAKPFIKKQSRPPGLVVTSSRERAYLFEPGEAIHPKLRGTLLKKAISLIENESAKGTRSLETKIRTDSEGWLYHKTITAPIIFNYYVRGEPRHLLNEALIPVADNFFAAKPIGISSRAAWLLLNTDVYRDALLQAARNQGNGLVKLQLYEYKGARVPDWRRFDNNFLKTIEAVSQELELGNESTRVEACLWLSAELTARGY